MSKLPSYSSLRGARSPAYVRGLPAAVVAVRLSPRVDPTQPATLLRRCVAVSATVHPVLDLLLKEAGASVSAHTYTLTVPTGRGLDPAVAAALSAVHPSMWKATTRQPVAEVLGTSAVTALAAAGVSLTTTRPRRMSGMALTVSRTGNRLRLSFRANVDVGTGLALGPAHRLLLTPPAAVDTLTAARAAGVVVLDADQPGRLADLEWLVDRGCVLTPVAGAPGWAELTCGPLVSAPAAGPLPAGEAVRLVQKMKGDVVAAVHPLVEDTAAAANALPTGRAGLRRWQDVFVSSYLASGVGLVNALAPGMGKTVCAAAAMRERALEAAPGRYRAVALVPAGVRTQWGRELGRFFPEACVVAVTGAADLPRLKSCWDANPEPTVALMTPELLARCHGELTGVRPDDLVVDEATFLRSAGSARVLAAWELRRRSRHAMALTGTPDGQGSDDVAALVAFVRNQPSLFEGYPLSQPHPRVGAARVGPLVFTGPDRAAAQLPAAAPSTVLLAPAAGEQTIERIARERVGALLSAQGSTGGRRGAPQLRTELDAWRLGLACPAALLGSRHGLAAQARAAGVGAALGTKASWAVGQASTLAAEGGQVLIFSDFPAALTATCTALTATGVSAGVISSAATAVKRQQQLDAFTDGRLQVLLIAASGQLGLNLQTAATVIHLDVPTSAATLLQRGARAARMGSRHRDVTVYVPVLRGCSDATLLKQVSGGQPLRDLWSLAGRLLTS